MESRLRKFEIEAICHLNSLMKAAIRIERNHAEAEDVVQETYLHAWKYFDSFVPGRSCGAWMFGIMFNLINKHKGKRARRNELLSENEMDISNWQRKVITFDPIKRIQEQRFLETMDMLNEEYRTVLWLAVVEEFTYGEIAEILGIPIGTVMSRLHRARRNFRRLV